MSHGANCGRRVTWTSGVERAGLSFAPLPSGEPASECLLHSSAATPVPTAPVRRVGVKVDLAVFLLVLCMIRGLTVTIPASNLDENGSSAIDSGESFPQKCYKKQGKNLISSTSDTS